VLLLRSLSVFIDIFQTHTKLTPDTNSQFTLTLILILTLAHTPDIHIHFGGVEAKSVA